MSRGMIWDCHGTLGGFVAAIGNRAKKISSGSVTMKSLLPVVDEFVLRENCRLDAETSTSLFSN